MSFNYLQFYVKMPVSYIPTSLPQEQAAIKLVWFQRYGSKYIVLCRVEKCVANTCIWLNMPHEAGKALHLMDSKEMAYT